MSKTLLVNLLKETLSMVAVDPKFDKAYRTLKSDMKEHSFRVHYRTIVKQIKVQLAFRYAKSNLDKYQEFTSLTPENRKKIARKYTDESLSMFMINSSIPFGKKLPEFRH